MLFFLRRTAEAFGAGGALLLPLVKSLMLSNCSFTTNAAVSKGGALYISNGIHVVVRNCFFESSSAQIGGGICHFLCNESPIGGVIAFHGTKCTLDVAESFIVGTNCKTNFSQKQVFDGAIYVNSAAAFVIQSSVFAGNEMGGGLALAATRGHIQNCSFYNNSGFFGGAIAAPHYPLVLIITNTTFLENRAVEGAAIFLMNKITVLQNCKFVAVKNSEISLIYISSLKPTDVRSASNLFVISGQTAVQNSVMTFDSDFPERLYMWRTLYQVSTQRVFDIDQTFLEKRPMPFLNVKANATFTVKYSLFASGMFVGGNTHYDTDTFHIDDRQISADWCGT